MRVIWFSLLLLICLPSFSFADDDLEIQLKRNITNYIVDCGYEPGDFPDAVVDVAYNEFGYDPWIFTMIAFYESHWNPRTVGAAGERGWIQIHPCHNKCSGHGVKTNGLSWDNPRDLLWVGCEMVRESMDNGASMYNALSPWTTRKRAWQRYVDYFGEFPRNDGKHPQSH